MANRNRKSQSPVYAAQDIPSEGKKRGLRPVSPPLLTTRLSRLLYILLTLTALLGAYYSYRIVQYKTQVGGWWFLNVGKKPATQPPPLEQTVHHGDSVEGKINDLARALGMPSKELASAIAVAVKNYVPPASLSSVAAEETGPAVQALLKGSPSEGSSPDPITTAKPMSSITSVVGGVASGFNHFVGMDEP